MGPSNSMGGALEKEALQDGQAAVQRRIKGSSSKADNETDKPLNVQEASRLASAIAFLKMRLTTSHP